MGVLVALETKDLASLSFGLVGFGLVLGAVGCSFFLFNRLLAHVYFLRNKLKNRKSCVELILGWIQDW